MDKKEHQSREEPKSQFKPTQNSAEDFFQREANQIDTTKLEAQISCEVQSAKEAIVTLAVPNPKKSTHTRQQSRGKDTVSDDTMGITSYTPSAITFETIAKAMIDNNSSKNGRHLRINSNGESKFKISTISIDLDSVL